MPPQSSCISIDLTLSRARSLACCFYLSLSRARSLCTQRFWTEVHDGAKLFYLSGLEKSGRYPKTEVYALDLLVYAAFSY